MFVRNKIPPILVCPVCRNILVEKEKDYQCSNSHNFNKSRDHSLNLLLPHMKRSKEPGDSKEMVKSRTHFLEKGYYFPISETLNHQINETLLTSSSESLQILDIGCGEGYYLRNLKSYIDRKGEGSFQSINYWGVDISKEAIKHAAKKEKNIKWIIGSAIDLPFYPYSLEGGISVFSPFYFSELEPLIKPNGYLYLITPGENHLQELRKIIFSEHLKSINSTKLLSKMGNNFKLRTQVPIQYALNLESQEEISSLFKMTPFYWKSLPEKQQFVLKMSNLNITVDVNLWVFQKTF